MLAALGLLHIDDVQRIPLNHGLRLQWAPFLFLNNTFCGSLGDGVSGFGSIIL